jgi:ubiquitin-conjugating enzyme E2 J2
MASEICIRRLTRELAAMKKDPILEPRITVAPNESNLLELHYVIEGSKGTPYEGGVYHGKLVFPKEYPLKPPGVIMTTPNGRFQPGRRLCFSMSDFHPESWNPMWSVSTILTGLYSFMIESSPTLGSIETSTRKKRQLAAASLEYNIKHEPTFSKLFPEYVARYEQELQQLQQQQKQTLTDKDDTLSRRSALPPAVAAGADVMVIPHALYPLAGIVAIVSIVFAVRFL